MDIKTLKNEAKKRLTPSRFNHTLRVFELSIKLSNHYGIDQDSAKIAALLHDIKKEESSPLKHSKDAMKYADEILPPELKNRQDILNAISYHTTGRANMSDLEKIIFLSDLAESGRDFVGIEEIRESLYSGLDNAMKEAMIQIFDRLYLKKIKPNKDGVNAYEYYVNQSVKQETYKTNLKNFTKEQLEKEVVTTFNQKKYRASQIYEWLYKGVKSFDEMTNIDKELISKLKNKTILYSLRIREVQISKTDETIKVLFETIDNEFIETVYMKYDFGITACVSTQIGCLCGCVFCESGKLKFKRNLTPAEIIDQLLLYNVLDEKHKDKNLNHVVFMGIGEPLLNFENVLTAIKNITDPKGLAFGRKHITVSTVGILPEIKEFIKLKPMANLAISLHATNDKQRSKLIPMNKKYPITQIVEYAKKYTKELNRRITFEFAMIKGVNDHITNAEELAKLVKGIDCHVNLIHLNGNNKKYSASDDKTVNEFKNILEKNKVVVTIRKSLGRDIKGACGELSGNRSTPTE